MSIKEAALKEMARLAELKLEATYLKMQEEAIQKQKMLAKELGITKAEARLKIYEEEDEEGSRRSSNLTSLSVKLKKEIVEDYLLSHQFEVKPKPGNVDSQISDKPDKEVKRKSHEPTVNAVLKQKDEQSQGGPMASLIQTLQLPEVEIDVFSGISLDFWFFMTSFAETVESRTSDS